MKKRTFITAIALCIATQLFAQAPQAFKYQTIVRNASGNIIASQKVNFKMSILQGSTSGTAVYSETDTATTNAFGLANLTIGNGVVVSGTFSAINWGNNSYFIQIGLDPTGGNSFTTMGTSQLLSVPYALNALSGGTPYTAGNGIAISNNVISTSPRIIAGNSSANGTGYTVSGATITFTTPFTSIPNATATPIITVNSNNEPFSIMITSISTTSMTVEADTWQNSGSQPVISSSGYPFSFVVVGN